MKSIVSLCSTGLILVFVRAPMAIARGLDTLSQDSPRPQDSPVPQGGEPSSPGTPDASVKEAPSQGGPGPGGSQAATPIEKSELSKAIQDKLRIGTGFGWTRGKGSRGDWTVSGGTSDISVEYRVTSPGSLLNRAATYRYTPYAATGRQDGQSFKAVWESHNLGFKFSRTIGRFSPYMHGEVGALFQHAQPTDGLPEKKSASGTGFQGVLGAGLDVAVASFPVVLGPRLHLGFGTIRTVQVASSFLYAF